jgi:anti-sigma factor RsiW
MNAPQCDQLDEYLGGWLPPEGIAHFEAHLASCKACREECALQRRLDRLLAGENARLARVPAGLASRIDHRILAARRRRIFEWTVVVTAAAGILLAFGLWIRERLSIVRHEEREIAQRSLVEPERPVPVDSPLAAKPPVSDVRVTMVDSTSAIVMPVESHRPNVTIVRIFPTIRVAAEVESMKSP